MSTSNNSNILDAFFKTFEGKTSSKKDIDEFGSRVLTYIDGQKWVRRPLILSPAVCSRYGWKCINSNLLECVTCGAKLCTPDPSLDTFDVYKACIEKIFQDLKANHKTHCPWPLTPSSDSFIKMPVMPKEESLKHFIQRLTPSITYPSSFPRVKGSAISFLGLENTHIQSLCKLAGISTKDITSWGPSAVVLSATGWCLKCEDQEQNKVFLKCENCQRSIWSGAFNSADSDPVTESKYIPDGTSSQTPNTDGKALEGSPPIKRKRFRKEDFDPIEEHRAWCLWIASDDPKYKFDEKGDGSDAGSADCTEHPPGWRIFLNSLLRNVTESQATDPVENPSKEQIRSVKNLLDSWTELTAL